MEVIKIKGVTDLRSSVPLIGGKMRKRTHGRSEYRRKRLGVSLMLLHLLLSLSLRPSMRVSLRLLVMLTLLSLLVRLTLSRR
jgi:hypothetical protein